MKTCLYIRVSTDKQQNGAQAQKRALLEYCKLKGIEDYQVYEDFGISGSKVSRPQLNKMMLEVMEGKVKAVLVYSFSRFARSTKHLIDALETFKEKEVNFVSLSENIDLASPLGRAVYTIISAIATLERDLISERVKLGLRNARAKGKKVGRKRTVNRELVLKLRGKGMTYREIAKTLGVSHGAITDAIKEKDGKS